MLLGGAAIYYWAFIQREHTEWSEQIRLWDGKRLEIQQNSSHKAYHGTPHHLNPFWWGGGDPWHITTFTWNDTNYCWEGPYIPIAIQPDQDGTFYIAVFDRETAPGKFRLYRKTTTCQWQEIDRKDFPRHLAIQNTWLSEENGIRNDHTVVNEYEIVANMNPADIDFRRSLTAKLWSYLENPGFSTFEDVPETFLQKYKSKWIRAANTDRHGSPLANQSGG